MKRRELLAHMQAHGCQFLREGANHSIWVNPLTGRKEAVPRHSEIKRHLARSICRNLAIAVPKGA
ncbi:MAG: type II toxin-antitoxin system HicA family toxin [Opitutaceae bacterium]|nr:type II toxin-antitoxin system HicA family toxin [Opitutaceae bacterium]